MASNWLRSRSRPSSVILGVGGVCVKREMLCKPGFIWYLSSYSQATSSSRLPTNKHASHIILKPWQPWILAMQRIEGWFHSVSECHPTNHWRMHAMVSSRSIISLQIYLGCCSISIHITRSPDRNLVNIFLHLGCGKKLEAKVLGIDLQLLNLPLRVAKTSEASRASRSPRGDVASDQRSRLGATKFWWISSINVKNWNNIHI